ncbi:MAG TPA: hypothetical protein VKS20_09780 [Candidatus Acidoferrales bacterium]|nr:hypothetical protein [Candidatus Acidoferrales bacterium]
MKSAAIGVRMHSGWGVVVAVSNDGGRPNVIARERIVVVDEKAGGKRQPYHFAKTMSLSAAEKYITRSKEESQRLAREAIRALAENLRSAGYRVACCALLTASGRALPELAAILAAHPLIHTAEGEFFRGAISEACGTLKIAVARVRERDAEKEVKARLGKPAGDAIKRIANARKTLGAPWTQEHKKAALAAWMALR